MLKRKVRDRKSSLHKLKLEWAYNDHAIRDRERSIEQNPTFKNHKLCWETDFTIKMLKKRNKKICQLIEEKEVEIILIEDMISEIVK